ncbi:hypothetical protein MNBD_GAMMA11-1461, partial [hydrothermal vent metagenome]
NPELISECASENAPGVIKKQVNGQSFASDVHGCTNIVIAGAKERGRAWMH